MGNLSRVNLIQGKDNKPGFYIEKEFYMTTDRKPYSGRGSKKPDLDSYMKKSKEASFGNNMRTFSRTKTSGLITSWDDVHFMTIKTNYFKFIADASGGVDNATVGDPGGLVLLNLLWETHFENANLKDLVVADENSWMLYWLVMAQICVGFQIQHNMRCYLPAYTESDIVPGTSVAITFLTQSSYDIFLASMKEFPVPKGIYEIVDIFCTWVVKITQEYERHTLRIPAAIFQPFTDVYDLEDYEAMRQLLRVNLGGFTTHAKKYGLGTSSWRDPVKPTEKTVNDVDVIAYFNHSHFAYYDNQPAAVTFGPNGGYGGANLTTDYTATEFAFKDSPNESKIHVLAPWFGIYNATNNPYGGFIRYMPANTAEYYVNLLFVAQHGTSVSAANLGDAIVTDTIILMHKCASDNVAATLSLDFSGTNFTAKKGVDDCWPLAYNNQLFYGTGRGAVETNNDIINFLGRAIR